MPMCELELRHLKIRWRNNMGQTRFLWENMLTHLYLLNSGVIVCNTMNNRCTAGDGSALWNLAHMSALLPKKTLGGNSVEAVSNDQRQNASLDVARDCI